MAVLVVVGLILALSLNVDAEEIICDLDLRSVIALTLGRRELLVMLRNGLPAVKGHPSLFHEAFVIYEFDVVIIHRATRLRTASN